MSPDCHLHRRASLTSSSSIATATAAVGFSSPAVVARAMFIVRPPAGGAAEAGVAKDSRCHCGSRRTCCCFGRKPRQPLLIASFLILLMFGEVPLSTCAAAIGGAADDPVLASSTTTTSAVGTAQEGSTRLLLQHFSTAGSPSHAPPLSLPPTPPPASPPRPRKFPPRPPIRPPRPPPTPPSLPRPVPDDYYYDYGAVESKRHADAHAWMVVYGSAPCLKLHSVFLRLLHSLHLFAAPARSCREPSGAASTLRPQSEPRQWGPYTSDLNGRPGLRCESNPASCSGVGRGGVGCDAMDCSSCCSAGLANIISAAGLVDWSR